MISFKTKLILLTDLVFAGDIAPEHYALLLRVIVDAMRTEAGDAHTLPLLHPVLDPVKLHYRSALTTLSLPGSHHLMSVPGGRNRTWDGRGCDRAPAGLAAGTPCRSRRG